MENREWRIENGGREAKYPSSRLPISNSHFPFSILRACQSIFSGIILLFVLPCRTWKSHSQNLAKARNLRKVSQTFFHFAKILVFNCLISQSLTFISGLPLFPTRGYLHHEATVYAQPYESPAKWNKPDQVPVDLIQFFNNDGVSKWTPEAPLDGNFDSPEHGDRLPGSCFPAEKLPRSGAIFSPEKPPNVSFLFPPKEAGAKNNIACSNEGIYVPVGHYRKLYILGAAEKASQESYLFLSYKEGGVNAPFNLSDWCSEAKFGEVEAVRLNYVYVWNEDAGAGKSRQAGAKEKTTAHLWIQAIDIDPNKRLESLWLPYNIRIHIFAMTLIAVPSQKIYQTYVRDTLELYKALSRADENPQKEFREATRSLQLKLDAAARRLNHRFNRETDWLQTQLDYCRLTPPAPRYRLAPSAARKYKALQSQIGRDINSLLTGRNPFPAKRGVILKSHRSEVDGTLQPYSLYVPHSYTGKRPMPLVLYLHWHNWYEPFQGHPAEPKGPAIVVSPHGRGSIDYMLVAEDDVIEVIEEVRRDYSIDPNRIYAMGFSMGGTGSWHLAVKHPDLFADISPYAANADHRAWAKEWNLRSPAATPQFSALRRFLKDECSPITFAENLLNTPSFCTHGDADDIVPVGHARNMTKRLRKLGCEVRYNEFPGVGHWGFPDYIYGQQYNWMMAHKRNPRPTRIRHKTAMLRDDANYWVRINRFSELLQFAEMSVESLPGNRIAAWESGVSNFTLNVAQSPLSGARELSVNVNGSEAYSGQKPRDGKLTLVERDDGGWREGTPPTGLTKRPGLEGPIEDAFRASFLIVYGTMAASDLERKIVKAEADRFVHDWRRLFGQPCRIKADTQVTDNDIKRHNLILYGSPSANSLVSRMIDRLPIRIVGKKIHVGDKTFEGDDLGVKFCYPNPYASNRNYVVIFAGTTWRGVFQINNRFGNWFGWGAYDNRNWFDYAVFDGKTNSPETFLCVGFFDQDWRLNPKYQRIGDAELRETSVPHWAPLKAVRGSASRPANLPDAAEVFLNDLMPSLIDQHKGAVSFNRSFEGNPLRIGGEIYNKGLGVKAPSIIEFDLGCDFASFHAEVGVDLEGAKTVSKARSDGEWIQFIVHGDGLRFYITDWLHWDTPPEVIDVPIAGVRKLRLEVKASSQRWLLGSAAWGEAKVSRETIAD